MAYRAVTIADIQQLIVDECDLDQPSGDTHVTAEMMVRWIRLSAQKLMAVLNELRGDNWNVDTFVLTTTPGVGFVNLSAEAAQLKSVVWARSATERVVLQRASHDELTDAPGGPFNAVQWEAPPRYVLRQNLLVLAPVPSAVYSLIVTWAYNYLDADLAADTDTIRLEPGFDDYLIYSVAARVYTRQEKMEMASYARNLAREAEAFIRSTAAGRDENGPMFARRLHDRRLLDEGEC